MNLFVSVVSHNDHLIIQKLDSLRRLALHEKVTVICRDNVPNTSCRDYCEQNGVHYQANRSVKGFSANNNANFIYAKKHLGMGPEDYFVLLNPDVEIDQRNIKKLICALRKQQPEIAAPCLYLDAKHRVFDDNLRKYPRLKNFAKNYVLRDRSTVIDKKSEEPEQLKYWVSASFMCVNSKIYEALEGFDETYHMYCEDVDFCARAMRKGHHPEYIRTVKAVHYRRRCSQKFLSKPFFWHVKSVLLYSLANHNFRKHKSVLAPSRRQLKRQRKAELAQAKTTQTNTRVAQTSTRVVQSSAEYSQAHGGQVKVAMSEVHHKLS